MDEMDEISESWVNVPIHLAGVRVGSLDALGFAQFCRFRCHHFPF
jgi:hypothetical protein